MSAVRRFREPEELSSVDPADEREVTATRFPDTRLPFIDDLAVKLDGLRLAVEGVVVSVLPFLSNPRRRWVKETDSDLWSSDETADPYPVEVLSVNFDDR
ncbi:hypothetical protein [Mycolicibacterium obuense]|uniref:hypothetical protein n=1 Tax=Mycolicibacterium obuense TaxID=1807 RepID=UPI000A94BE9C|nr:hypothetical protein [Mycolicibacterium obuense]